MSRDRQHSVLEKLITLEAAAIASLIPVALYQTDKLAALHDPPMSLFDSEGIASSRTAHPLGVPDAILGILNFSITAILAHKAHDSPQAMKALAFKLVVDAGFAAFNLGRQIFQFRKLCSWCTAAGALALVASVVGREAILGSSTCPYEMGSHNPRNQTSRIIS